MLVWSDFASATLAATLEQADATATVDVGSNADFPVIDGGQYAIGVLEDIYGNKEVVHITGYTGENGEVIAIVRGQEGTPARKFEIGSRIEVRATQQFLEDFADGGAY